MAASSSSIHAPNASPSAAALAGLFVFTLLGHLVWYGLAAPGGDLADGDGYLRLLRVERLWENGDWFDTLIARANAPFGTTMHWTRPLDALIALMAAPMVPFVGARAAVFWGGVLSNPLLHAAGAAAIAWGSAPLVGRSAAILAALVAVAQPALFLYSTASRADHHALFGFLAALGMGIMIRALRADRASVRWAFGAGLVGAASLWVGIEALALIAVCLAGFALAWALGRDQWAAARVHVFARGLALGLVAALLAERGFDGVLRVEYDRISIVHMVLGVLILAGAAAIRAVDERRPNLDAPRRSALGALCALAVFAAWWNLYPDVLRNPMRVVDFEIGDLIDRRVRENGSALTIELFAAFFGAAILALGFLAARARALWAGPDRWAWLFIALGVAVYGGVSAGWMRWSLYAGIFPCAALGAMIQHAVERIESSIAPRALREASAAAVVFAIIVGPMAITAGASRLFGGGATAERGHGECRVAPLADVLGRAPWSDRSRVVLLGVDYGPEVLYRTGHAVVGTLHHRNVAGIKDTRRAFAADDEAIPRAIVARRGIELIAVCPLSGGDGFEAAGGESGPFHRRLATGAPPSWLREIALSPGATAFRLFAVVSD